MERRREAPGRADFQADARNQYPVTEQWLLIVGGVVDYNWLRYAAYLVAYLCLTPRSQLKSIALTTATGCPLDSPAVAIDRY